MNTILIIHYKSDINGYNFMHKTFIMSAYKFVKFIEGVGLGLGGVQTFALVVKTCNNLS